MKKLIILIGILALTLGLFATEVVIGTGTATQRFPLGSFYGFERSAALYTAAEIGPHNTEISAISWYSSIATTAEVPTKIYLKTSSSPSLATDTWANMITGAILLYDSPYTGTVAGGWNSFTLSSTFRVDMGDNLMILVERNFGGSGSSTAGGSSTGGALYSTPLTGTHLTWQADQNPPTGNGTIAANRPNVTITYTTYAVDTPPFPANIISPANGATLVRPSATLIWNSGGGAPTGYKVHFGTTNPPPFIQNTTQTSYAPTLATGTTYYWKIIPFNTIGDAPACPVWSFTTHGNATVTTLPYSQNWDLETAPNLPFDWTAIIQSSATTAIVETYTTTATYAHSLPNCVRLYNPSDADATLLLVGPPLGANLNVNTVRVRFWARASGAGYPISIGVMTDPANPATYTEVHNLSLTTTVSEYALSMAGYTGTGTHIAFKHGLGGTSRNLYVDDIAFEQISPNDLACIALNGNTTPSVNNATIYTASIYNWGTATQNTYTVKLYNAAGTELASSPGVSVAPSETAQVALTWTPTVEGPASLYAKVILTGDINPVNDQSPNLNIAVMPAGVMMVTVGDGNLAEGIPLEFFYRHSLFQCLYYPTEIGMYGNVTALTFYNNFFTNLTDMPVKFWLGQTDETDLSAGWIMPTGNFTMVYDGTMNFPSGANTITIPLQAVFPYTGGNLVLYALRPMDTGYYSSSDNFEAQTVGTNRARKLQSDGTVYDPEAPPSPGTLSGTFPMTTFHMTPLSNDPFFIVNPSSKDYGTVLINTTVNQTFSIMNGGGGSLTITNIAISGSPFFSLQSMPTLPVSLATGQTATFVGRYSPTAEGAHTATITITDNRGNRMTHTVALNGTCLDTTVNTLPYSQNFDDLTPPVLPLDWSSIYQASVATGYVKTVTTSPHSAPNCVAIYNPTDVNTIAMLIAPPLNASITMNSVRVKFWGKGSAAYHMLLGVMSDPLDPATFTQVADLNVVSNWNEYIISLGDYAGTGRFIAFKHANAASGQTIYLDDVRFEQMGPNDLACTALAGNTTPAVNTPTTYTASVFNWGTATQNTYTVKLFKGNNVEIATATGVSVAPAQSVEVPLLWTPGVEGTEVLYAKVFLTGDIDPTNDQSPNLNILVTGAGTMTVSIGDGTATNTVTGVPTPYGTYYKNFHQQYLWTADEILNEGGDSGMITSVGFNVQAVNNCSPMPNYTIRLKHTQQTVLTTNFEDGEYTQVWFQNDFLPVEGWNTHPFATPFEWDGVSNLLVDIYTTVIPGSYSQNATVYYTPTPGVNTSLRYQSDSVDAISSATGTVSVNRANVRFSMQLGELLTNDLAGMSLTGSSTPSVGSASNYSVNLRNRGSAVQNTYQVKLYTGNNVEVASAPGVPIQSGEVLAVSVPWTPTAEGQQTLNVKVVLATDENPDNNQTPSLNVFVMAAGTTVIEIGNGTAVNTTSGIPTPYGTFYKNFHQQYLYTAAEILAAGGTPGFLTSLSFNVQTLNNISPMPNYTIKLKNTQQSVLSTTFETGDYTQVWFQNDFTPAEGWNNHPLTSPYFWDGSSNLLVDIVTTLIPGAYSQNASVYYTPTPGNTSLRYQSDTVDASTSATGTISVNRANTRFSLNNDGLASLNGVVSSGGAPLEGVQISLDVFPMTQTTAADGSYSFPYVIPSQYTVTAFKLGYETQTAAVNLVADQTITLNFNLVASQLVTVSGMVVGSDQPTVGLADVAITLDGPLDYTGTTNASGQFAITEVLSGNSYNYMMVKDGYQNLSGTINVASANYNMGTLTMAEIALPPFNVLATENAAQTQVSLSWRTPTGGGRGGNEDFEQDNGDWVSSGFGDWQWGNNYNVANHVDIDTYADSPPQAAHSGTGMWGTVLMGGYANSGAWSYLKKTFNLSGQTNPVLDFWHYMDGYNTWDYGLIVVNGSTVWGSSALAVFMPWQNLVIDLSAYAGQSEVEISFEWYATTTVSYAGWYIDDLYVGPSMGRTSNYARSSAPKPVRIGSEIAGTALRVLPSMKANQSPQARNARPAPDRVRTGFKVWRLTQGNETTEASWTLLTTTAIQDTVLVDPAWATLPDGNYKWAVKAVYTNNVLSNPAFSNMLRILHNDMAALSIEGTYTPAVAAPSIYNVRVKNTGTDAQPGTAYTVKLMSGTTELASLPGVTLAPNAEHLFPISWTPATGGTMDIFGKVVLPGDSVPANDASPSLTIFVLAEGTTIPPPDPDDGNQTARIPIDMFYKSSVHQYLIYPAEISNLIGQITGLALYNQFTQDLMNKSINIWMGTTPLADLSAGWIPVTGMTQVFSGTLDFLTGSNTIIIPFSTPYLYLNGENIVLTFQRPQDTAYYASSNYFRAQTRTPDTRARNIYSDSVIYDPAAMPTTGGSNTGQFAKTTFYIIPGGVGHLNGTVTGTGGIPLEGVSVQFTTGGYTASTNAQGQYTVHNILPNTYTVNFSAYGYQNASRTVTIVEDVTATLNVPMTPMAMVNVTGTVIGSDTQAGISGAAIHLTGYADYTVNSTANGTFTIPGVYANNSYSYTIMAPGYTTANGMITVGPANYNMATVTLNELAYAPNSLLATVNVTGTAVDLTWLAPDPNAVQITESFEADTFPPQNWTQVITNTGGPTSSGVYYTFCKIGAITVAGQAAAPTDGDYQCGLWWVTGHQDEWLITPSFNCPPAGYLNFDSYVFLGSINHDHYYVQVSADNGITWAPIWDASAQTGGWNYYASPINVDLSAYSGMQIQLAFNATDGPTDDGLWYVWFFDNIYIGNAITASASPAVTIRFSEEDLLHKSGLSSGLGIVSAETRAASRAVENGGARTENHLPVPQPTRNGQPSGATIVGYKLWRLATGQENNESAWAQLTPDIINQLSFPDPAWQTLPNGSYRWAVKAIYTNSVASVPSFSNVLDKVQETGMVAGVVRRLNTVPIQGATVTAGGLFATTNTAGAYTLVLPIGTYDVSCSASGYQTQTANAIVISPSQTTTLNFIMDVVSNEDEVVPVTATALLGNYPNPFNPETSIGFCLKEASEVRLEIYNSRGQRVRTLIDETKSSGWYQAVWNGRDDNGNPVSSGVYMYRMAAGSYLASKKMMLMQ